MIATTPTLQWSESEPSAEVQTGEQLDRLLDRLAATARPELPISVRLRAHGFEADILLGLPESFVYLTKPTQYFITVGNSGVVSFYLMGQHHTEFERRHLIPMNTARCVLREFFDTGQRPTSVEWEESPY